MDFADKASLVQRAICPIRKGITAMEPVSYFLAVVSFLFGLLIGCTIRMRSQAERMDEDIQRQRVLHKLGALVQAQERMNEVAERWGSKLDEKHKVA